MKKKTTTKNTEKIAVCDGVAISNINNYSDDCTFFNLIIETVLGELTIYSCKVISGRKGDFISFPSRKGSDDNFYSHVFVKISDEIVNNILDTIAANI